MAAHSPATSAVTDALTRCRASQRRFRNTLLFVSADESALATARQAMRRALAWQSIAGDKRFEAEISGAQLADARDKAKGGRAGAVQAVRAAWSHVLFPVKNDETEAGRAFDLEHISLNARDRANLPAAVYEKAKSDGIISEKLGGDSFWHHLEPLWPLGRPHLPVAEIADWFATYVYLPKLRDRVVLEAAIGDACARLNPAFACAEGFDEAAGRYLGLLWQKAPVGPLPPTSLLVRPEIAVAQLQPAPPPPAAAKTETISGGDNAPPPSPPSSPRPKRFYGSVEIDTLRPVKAFDSILNAVVMELQRTHGTKVTLTLEIEATAPDGFAEPDIAVVRDNARALKFKPNSTGFD